MSRSKLIETLDNVFSKYIRLVKSTDGLCKCISCGVVDNWKYMDNGHFIKRSNMATRWDVDNCNPQCTHCNRFLNGNIYNYHEAIGDDLAESLTQIGHTTAKYSTNLGTYKLL